MWRGFRRSFGDRDVGPGQPIRPGLGRAGDVVIEAIRVAKRSDPLSQLAGAITAAHQHLAADTLADVVERDSLIALGEVLARENAARGRGRERALLIRIDELQNANESQRSAILAALGDVLEHRVVIDTRDGTGSSMAMHLPVLFFLTGLPELLNGSTDVDTFRRRFNTTPLAMLTDDEIVDALSDPLPGGVGVDPQAALRFAATVAGDPYFFQLVGQYAWDVSAGDSIVVDDVDQADRETYGTRLRIVEAAANDIPAGEMAVLQAVYEVAGDQLAVSGAEVARHLGKKAPEIATAAQRLERRAAIARDRGVWRIENRLLHRYLVTGDIVS